MTRLPFALVFCFMSLFSITPARAHQATPANWPPPIASQIAQLRQQCLEVNGKPSDGSETIKTADLEGNGTIDYILFVGDYNCDGAASLFSPTAAAGAEADLYTISKNGRASLAWTGDVWDTAIETRNGHSILTVSSAGTDCGEATPAKDIASMARCRVWIKYDKQKNIWEPIILK